MPTSFSVDVSLNLMSQMQGLSSSLSGAQRQVDSLGKSFSQLFAFHEMEKGGKAILGVVSGMVHGAMDLQSAMANVGLSTGASVQQMGEMKKLVMGVSQTGLMTSVQAGNMAAQLARSGFAPKEISALMPTIGKFGDVLHATRGTSFEASADFGAEMAHYYKAYDAKSAAPIIEAASKVMQTSLGTPQALFTQLQKFGNLAGFMGMSPEKQMQMAAMGMNMGDKQFGTGLSNIILGSIPKTASLSATRLGHQGEALKKLGFMGEHGENLAFSGAGGGLNMDFIVAQLAKRGAEMKPADFAEAVTNAFNKRGGRLAMTMADTRWLERLKDLPNLWNKIGSLDTQHDKAMATANSQLTLLTTNVQNIGIAMGEGLLPTITKATTALATFAGGIANHINGNPQLKEKLGSLLGIGATGGAVLAGVGAVGSVIATMRIMASAFKNGAMPVTVVNGAALGLGGALGGATGGAAGVMSRTLSGIKAGTMGWAAGRIIGELGADDGIQADLKRGIQDKRDAVTDAQNNENNAAFWARKHEQEARDKTQAEMNAQLVQVNLHVDGKKIAHAIVPHLTKAAGHSSGQSRSGAHSSPYNKGNKGQ